MRGGEKRQYVLLRSEDLEARRSIFRIHLLSCCFWKNGSAGLTELGANPSAAENNGKRVIVAPDGGFALTSLFHSDVFVLCT